MRPFSTFSHTRLAGVPFAVRNNPPSYLRKRVGEERIYRESFWLRHFKLVYNNINMYKKCESKMLGAMSRDFLHYMALTVSYSPSSFHLPATL